MSFFAELNRRNVLRAAAAYVAVAWLLIQVAETTFPAFGLGDSALRTLIILLGIGLVPAVALSWAFDLTPEGLRRDRDVPPGSELSLRTRKSLDRGIIAVLALGLVYFAVDKFVLDPERDDALVHEAREAARSEAMIETYGDKSIAVLAFEDMSPDGDQEYLSDGIAEELLNLLAGIPELRVISRSSAFSYKGKDVKLSKVAEDLDVAHILEGSVRKAGNRIRITAQLIDARADTHLWSETYDRDFGDIFAIQDEIAQEVVGELRVRLLGDLPAAKKTDPEAYALYLRAAHAMNQMHSDSPKATEDLANQALEIDPDYVPALVLLSRARMYYATWGQATPGEAAAKAAEAAMRAIALDPDNAQANLLLDVLDPRAEQDAQYVADALNRAIRRAPADVDILRRAAIFSMRLGRLEQAIGLFEYTLSRDPLCTQCLYAATRAYMAAGRLDDAEQVARSYIALTRGGTHTLGVILLLKGDNEAAKVQFDSLGENMGEPTRLHGRALGLYAVGQLEEFEVVFSQLREQYGEGYPGAVVNPLGFIAEIYAWTGDNDAAFDWLERALEKEGPNRFLHISPLYRNLHDDPRWLPLLERIGQAPAQLAAVRFDVSVPE